MTRLMLVRDSAPLAGMRVRIKGVEGDFRSDDDGMVEIPVDEEKFSVAVHDTNDWIVRNVRRTNPSASMIVVDLSAERESRSSRWDLSDRYTFEKVLGRGGMGVVVKALDTVLHRPVAIKMLSEEFLDNQEAQQLFMTEGRAMATLSHPNLVTVHDVTEVNGRVLMVQEFVEGQNVETLLKNRMVLTASEAISITIQVFRALEYLHNQGAIHRDLKPGNFMIKPSGTVKVIDFGLSRSLDDLYDKGTRVRGTPAYMAPEQIQGHKLSAATDIYQMGVSLWEMLCGKLPYSGEQLYKHVHADVPSIRDVDQSIDSDLDVLVQQCLQKSPDERPGTATAVRIQLESIYDRIATDPNLETAVTAHAVESSISGSQPRLTPPGSSPSSGANSDMAVESTEPKSSRVTMIFAVGLLALVLVGISYGFLSGAFSTDGSAVNAFADPISETSVETTPTEPVVAEAEAEPPVETALILARRTVGSGISASRAGTWVVDEFRAEQQARQARKKRPTQPSEKKAPVRAEAPKAAPEKSADSPEEETAAAEKGAAKAEESADSAAKKVDEPKPFQPETFKPVTSTSSAKKTKKKSTPEKKKADPETKKKPEAEEKKEDTQVPVSF